MDMVKPKKCQQNFSFSVKQKNAKFSKTFLHVKIFLLLHHHESQILLVKSLKYHVAYNFVYQLVTILDPVNISTLNIKLWLIVIP